MSKNTLLETPVSKEWVKSTTTPPPGTKTNGESGVPQRTGGGIPEVTYDKNSK